MSLSSPSREDDEQAKATTAVEQVVAMGGELTPVQVREAWCR